MKYCVECGKENNDEAKFCINCGHNFENNETNVEYVQVDPIKKENSLAKVSLILGIISIGLMVIACCFPVAIITGPIAVVTGIIALVKTPNVSKSKAITGIVLGGIALLLSIIMFTSIEPMLEFLEEYVENYCMQYPDSEECLTYKEAFPQWFN